VPSRSAVAPLVGLFLASLALRPQLLAIGPLLPQMRVDLGMSHGVAGLLGTIPVLCMGIFAPIGPRLVARIGVRAALTACLTAISILGVARAVAPDAATVLAATLAIGVAVGTAGAIPAIVVKLRAPSVPALGTGAYAGGIVAGSTIAAAAAVPLAGTAVDWRFALAVISIASVVPIAAWLILVRPDRPDERNVATPPRLPWRSATGWLLALLFGLQSMIYYGLVAWLANVYVERGWDQASAGSLLATMNGIGLLTTIGVPLVADRLGSRRGQLLTSALAILVALLGVLVVPGAGFVWSAALGLALGAIFPIVLTLPVDVADAPGEVGAVAALMLLGGYILSSTGPVVLGAIRDVTGDFQASLWSLVGLAVALVVACLALSPRRLRHGIRREMPTVA
jgi:MFS transporter, CP family, cyanate transporter